MDVFSALKLVPKNKMADFMSNGKPLAVGVIIFLDEDERTILIGDQ
jgi:hypothetical protein